MNPIIIAGDLVTRVELDKLARYVRSHPEERTVHNLVMSWLDRQPVIMERFRVHGVLKAYGAYLLEYLLTK
jgi:hypothetical protein